MSVVKIGNKEQLEKLQARLTLRLGKRPTQQEVLDLCVQLGIKEFDELIELIENPPILSKEKVKRILNRRDTRENIPYEKGDQLHSEEDRDIYGDFDNI